MAPYPYQRLDLPRETRILHIEPGSFGDAIVCSLAHMRLGEHSQPYEGLSYCWGKSVNVEFIPPSDTMVGWAYGTGQGESGETRFRDMQDHPELHKTYIQFGGQLSPGSITCDGVSMEIGGELHRAIRRLRNEDRALRIWVDALCIDQNNIEERNKHVLIMGDVYAGASHVRIWLGEETGIERLALSVLDDVSAIAAESFDATESGTLNFFEARKRLLTNPKAANIEWEYLQPLFNRAWFNRIWVLQEAANASKATIHLGECSLDWEWLSESMHFARIFKLDAVLRSFSMKSLGVMQWLRGRKDLDARFAVPLLDLLEETRVFESTLPGDKVYGVLSLADQEVNVPVDYALTGESIFTHLALEYLENHHSLDILSHCMAPALPSKLSLPSWVPDWTVHGWVEPFRSRELNANAAGASGARITVNKRDSELAVVGKLLSRIEAIENTKEITRLAETPKALGAPTFGIKKINLEQGETVDLPSHGSLHDRTSMRQRHHMNEAAETLFDMHKVASPAGTPTPEVREAMARTFACNRTRDGSALGADFKLGFDLHSMITCTNETFESVCRWMIQEATGASETSREGRAFEKKMMKAYEEVIGAHQKFCFNRRFIRTADGNFGWVVNGTKVGDVIALFYGASYPFVLREQASGRYQIIGDCYLDQFMDGEGMGPDYLEQEFILV
ncbi:hypothetical protein PWT90_00349 [Aphanocladium album]|nr:hypothetical protein PWT90_00349 [Aphanocladium album]